VMLGSAYCVLVCATAAGKDFTVVASLKVAERNSGFQCDMVYEYI
jgi:hypothetical protein